MKNISASLLHTAWTEEEKEEIDDALVFVENYSGTDFLQDACLYIYHVLKLDYIFIGLLNYASEVKVETIILLHKGIRVNNISYALSGSVCETVIGKEQNYFPTGIQDLFSKNELLQTIQVDSYLGIPLFDSNDKGIGCLALLHHIIIERGGFVEALANVLLPRIEEELINFDKVILN